MMQDSASSEWLLIDTEGAHWGAQRDARMDIAHAMQY
jgi:hypothetical protein